jgi:hypothetical protein
MASKIMHDYAYLGNINVKVNRQKLTKLTSPEWVEKISSTYYCHDVEQYDIVNRNEDLDSVHVIATNHVDWHSDYKAISTMLVIECDRHIIQSWNDSPDNNRVLKHGDILRLNIDRRHRLISQNTKPGSFIALTRDLLCKMTFLEAKSFFKFFLSKGYKNFK